MLLEVQLNERLVSLTQVFLSETDLGLIEGRPTHEDKRTLLGWHGSISGALWPNVPAVVLGWEEHVANPNSALPRFRFIGAFESYGYIRDKQKWGSRLICVWYQDEMVPLISQRNMGLMFKVEWNKIAVDFDPF